MFMGITRSVLTLLFALGSVQGLSAEATSWYPSQAVTESDKIDMQPLRCPTVGKDHSQMISNLHALQDKIKSDANCDKLAKNLESVGQLAGDRRNAFLETIAKINSGTNVDDKTMNNFVVKYAEDVTVAVGSLATLLTQSGQCFGEQDMSTSLFTLSAFVNEASTLLSTVAGPWGPALSIGGKVVAGFLTGVNKFIASLPGYDFKDKKDWQGYVETLCTFHEQQDEIYALIHPDAAIEELSNLNQSLESQLVRLLASTPHGSELVSLFNAKDNDGLAQITNQIHAETNTEIGLQVVRLMTAQRWIQDRIQTIEVEAQDPLAPGQYLVQKQRDEIEDFLIARQGPKFINFQVKEARKAISNLDSFVVLEGMELYQRIESLVPDRKPTPIFLYPAPDEILKALVTTNENDFYGRGVIEQQIYSSLVYFKRELSKKWDAITIAYGVKSSFCTFFERAGYYSPDLMYSCASRNSSNIEARISDFEELGLKRMTPPYLRKAATYQGANWAESLEAWIKHLD